MSNYFLSIVVYGPGTDSNNRSHWAFAIQKPGMAIGTILHVSLIDLQRLIYQFDERSGVTVQSQGSEGAFAIARLAQEQVSQAVKVIREEPAPRDGVERCQDWVLRAMISLEAEEIVPPGTSAWIQSLVGKSAEAVAQAVGRRWVATAGQ